jgi:integrase
MRWVPMIGAYSGMRSGEICSLTIADVRQEDGTWFFDITAAKTEAGVRRVPVHSEIIKAGFLEYVAGLPKDGPVFTSLRPGGPDAKRNWYFSKRFGVLRKRLGIGRPRVGFHSFRKSAVTKLERAGIHESEAVQVLGHEKMSITYKVYGSGVRLRRLQEIVESIHYQLGDQRSD